MSFEGGGGGEALRFRITESPANAAGTIGRCVNECEGTVAFWALKKAQNVDVPQRISKIKENRNIMHVK